jgi:MOSC domain-containing protein YiiM
VTSIIAGIFTSPKAAANIQSVPTAHLEAGRGIVGDRYFASDGTFSEKLEGRGNSDWEVTLIETEEIDRFNEEIGSDLGYGDFRRNIATRGIKLNSLVGQRFSVGGVELEGIRLCEPCAHLASLVDDRILPAMVGRGGLRARILGGGEISVGDRIEIPAS